MRFIRNNFYIIALTFLLVTHKSYSKSETCVEAGNFGNYITGGTEVNPAKHLKNYTYIERFFPIQVNEIKIVARGLIKYVGGGVISGLGIDQKLIKTKKGNSYNFYLDLGEGVDLRGALGGKDSFYTPVAGISFKNKNKPTIPNGCSKSSPEKEIKYEKSSIGDCSKITLFLQEDIKQNANAEDNSCYSAKCDNEISVILENNYTFNIKFLEEKYGKDGIEGKEEEYKNKLSKFFSCLVSGKEDCSSTRNEISGSSSGQKIKKVNNALENFEICIKSSDKKIMAKEEFIKKYYYLQCEEPQEKTEMIYFDDVEIVRHPVYDDENTAVADEATKPEQKYQYQIKKNFKANQDGDVYFFIGDKKEEQKRGFNITTEDKKYFTNGDNLNITIYQYDKNGKINNQCKLDMRKYSFSEDGKLSIKINRNEENIGVECIAGYLSTSNRYIKFIFSIKKDDEKDEDDYYYGRYEISAIANNPNSYFNILDIRENGDSFIKSILKEIDGYIPYKKSYNESELRDAFQKRIKSDKDIDEFAFSFDEYCGHRTTIEGSLGNNNKELIWEYTTQNGWVKDGNICKYENNKNDNIGLVKKIYTSFIKNDVFRNSINLILILSVIFYTISLMTGSSDLSREEIINKAIRISIAMVFLHPDYGFTWFNEIFLTTFKAGLANLSYSIFNSLTLTSSVTHDASDMAMGLFHPQGFNIIFNDTFVKKLIGLLFSYPLGTFSLLLIVGPALFMYIKTFFHVLMMYFITHLTISLMFILAPIFIAAFLFDSTKPMMDSWIENLFSFSAQQLTLLITFKFFDGIIIFLLKNAFAYEACQKGIFLFFFGKINVFAVEEMSMAYAYKFLLLYMAIFFMKELISFVNEIVSDIFDGFSLGHMTQQSMRQVSSGIGKIKGITSNMGSFSKKGIAFGAGKLASRNTAKRIEGAMDSVSNLFDDKKTPITDYIKGAGPLNIINRINREDSKSKIEIVTNQAHTKAMIDNYDYINDKIKKDIKDNRFKYYGNSEALKDAKEKIINDNINNIDNLTQKEKRNMKNALVKNNKKLSQGNWLYRGYTKTNLNNNKFDIKNDDLNSNTKDMHKGIIISPNKSLTGKVNLSVDEEIKTHTQIIDGSYKSLLHQKKNSRFNINKGGYTKDSSRESLEKIRDAFNERNDKDSNSHIKNHLDNINKTLESYEKTKNEKR
jgi:type IV secretory pathway VirB6-like protein